MAGDLRFGAALFLLLFGLLAGIARAEVLEDREAEPIVLAGAETPRLLGVPPEEIVGFAWFEGWGQVPDGWVTVPVQVDERTLAEGGIVYEDPETGGDPLFDHNDEVAMMAFDAGLPAGDRQPPEGVDAESRTSVTVTDPLDPDRSAFVYLFRATDGSDPAGGYDLVDYDGSSVLTARYDAGLRGIWLLNHLSIAAARGADVDILDGDKLSVGTGCETSELSLNRAGAVAASIDGPVRAIRSVTGSVGGAEVRKDYLFYEGMLETRTSLEGIAGPERVIQALDLSARGIGSSYRNSRNETGVLVDGAPDQLEGGSLRWEQVSGDQGSITSVTRLGSAPAGTSLGSFHEDMALPPDESPMLCSGDDHAYGAAGPVVRIGEAPDSSPGESQIDLARFSWFDGAEADAALGQLRSRQVDSPLEAEVGRPEPPILVARVRPSRIAMKSGSSRTIRVVVRNHGRRNAKALRICAGKANWNRSRDRCRKAAGLRKGRALTRRITIRASGTPGRGARNLWIRVKAGKAHAYGDRIRVKIKPR